MEKNLEIKQLLDAAYDYLKSNREDGEISEIYSGYNFVPFEELCKAIDLQIHSDAFLEALKGDTRFVKNGDNEWDINRQRQSMTDCAYEYLKEIQATNPAGNDMSIEFQSLFDVVYTRLGLTATEALKKKGSFYTNLTLDGRFVILGNYKWDLRENRKYEDCPDINAFYVASDDDDRNNLDVDELDDEEKDEIGIEIDEDNDYSESESDND